MAQDTTGLRSILSAPWVYDAFQRLVGVAGYRRELVRSHFRLFDGARILDIGCGTGELLEALPRGLRYLGIDLSQPYVDRAKARFGDRGTFLCADVDAVDIARHGPFDHVIATGLLHHLDDAPATRLLQRAGQALVPGGLLIAVEPTLVAGQARLARELILRDRGRNVRTPEGYLALAQAHFAAAEVEIRSDLLRIPYTHCILICRG